MTRVLLVANTAWYLYNYRLPLARMARQAGLEVHLASPLGSYTDGLQAAGFPWHPIRLMPESLSPWRDLQTLRDLRALYRRLQPDLVHHFTIKPILYGSLAAGAVPGVAVVNAVTGLGRIFAPRELRWRALRALVVPMLRHALRGIRQRVVFQHRDDLHVYRAMGLVREAQAVVIPGSGVDLRRLLPSPEPAGDPVVLFASRMLWSKGPDALVQAVSRLRQQGLPVRLRLLGGVQQDDWDAIPHATLEAWDRLPYVQWLGHRDRMEGYYRGCHIVALPTRYREGIPLHLLEAAACARPIVATDMPGIREIVYNGQNGLLVPPGDEHALAEALAALVQDPALRRSMGLAGRRLVEAHFSSVEIGRRTLEVYTALLAERVEG